MAVAIISQLQVLIKSLMHSDELHLSFLNMKNSSLCKPPERWLVGWRDFRPRGKLLIILSTHSVFPPTCHMLLLVIFTPLQLSAFTDRCLGLLSCKDPFTQYTAIKKYIIYIRQQRHKLFWNQCVIRATWNHLEVEFATCHWDKNPLGYLVEANQKMHCNLLRPDLLHFRTSMTKLLFTRRGELTSLRGD